MAGRKRHSRHELPTSSRIHNLEEEEEEEYYGVLKPYYILNLHVHKARNTENLTGPFTSMDGMYQIIVTDSKHRRELKSIAMAVEGNPEPVWDCSGKIVFDELPAQESLYLEVVQFRNGSSDPGTSSGAVVVGRAKIPVPIKARDYGWRAHKLIRFVGSERKTDGLLLMKLDLKK